MRIRKQVDASTELPLRASAARRRILLPRFGGLDLAEIDVGLRMGADREA